MKMLLRILALVSLLLLGLALSGCSGFVAGDIFEVNENVDFGKKVNKVNDEPFLFPVFGTSGSFFDAGFLDFEFQCKEYSCTTLKTDFGMSYFAMYGIPVIPFFPTWSKGYSKQRLYSMICSVDFPDSNIPEVLVHTPDGVFKPFNTSAYKTYYGFKGVKSIHYSFAIENVDFDSIQFELDGECGNLIIPYERKKSYLYVPLFLPNLG